MRARWLAGEAGAEAEEEAWPAVALEETWLRASSAPARIRRRTRQHWMEITVLHRETFHREVNPTQAGYLNNNAAASTDSSSLIHLMVKRECFRVSQLCSHHNSRQWTIRRGI